MEKASEIAILVVLECTKTNLAPRLPAAKTVLKVFFNPILVVPTAMHVHMDMSSQIPSKVVAILVMVEPTKTYLAPHPSFAKTVLKVIFKMTAKV